jgi:hypothetical protein
MPVAHGVGTKVPPTLSKHADWFGSNVQAIAQKAELSAQASAETPAAAFT